MHLDYQSCLISICYQQLHPQLFHIAGVSPTALETNNLAAAVILVSRLCVRPGASGKCVRRLCSCVGFCCAGYKVRRLSRQNYLQSLMFSGLWLCGIPSACIFLSPSCILCLSIPWSLLLFFPFIPSFRWGACQSFSAPKDWDRGR